MKERKGGRGEGEGQAPAEDGAGPPRDRRASVPPHSPSVPTPLSTAPYMQLESTKCLL